MTKTDLPIIIKTFRENENPNYAIPMKKYMRNKFEMIGLHSAERKELQKKIIHELGFPEIVELDGIIKALWNLPERDYQYFAVDILIKMINKADKSVLKLLEFLIVNKSWWDTIDPIAANIVGKFFTIHPEYITKYTEKWMKSGNFWLQRVCLIFQLRYKEKTDFGLMTNYIMQLSKSKEFFLQKAIGWALREYSKTYPQKVKEFIQSTQLSNLSVKEGMKYVD